MSTISVIVPTLNRPSLLIAAVNSAVRQSRTPVEIIVVDDGSEPAVNADDLRKRFGTNVRVIRNEQSQGLAWARHQGVEAAVGDYVVHLDDDDLYAPNLISECAKLLDDDISLDLVFIGVEGFGSRAGHFNSVQPEGISRVVQQGGGEARAAGVYIFDRKIVAGLLNQVPMSFQRVMARRRVWHKVSQLRSTTYQRVFRLATAAHGREMVRGTLRDSEWAIYSGLACEKLAFLEEPLYLQRCEGQGGSSQPAMRQRHTEQMINIKTVLHDAARDNVFSGFKRDFRNSLAQTHFDAAYELLGFGLPARAAAHLWKAFWLRPNVRHVKLVAKLGFAVTTGRYRMRSA